MKKFNFLGLLLILSLLAACQSTSTVLPSVDVSGKSVAVDGGSYTDVTPPELQTMLASKDFVFINVHIPFEGDIDATDLSIPYDEISQNLDKLPADKSARVVLYCRSGRMSDIAARELVGLGYTNIWNLAGGMVAWEAAGYSIER
jgi:rhodanese-related sulfurtransferase